MTQSPQSFVADLHTHSRESDGTQSPSALVHAAAAAGVTVLGLTDHDTVRGWDEATEAAEEIGIGLVRGAELSTLLDGATVHLLAYLFEPEGSVLMDRLAQVRASRIDRAREMVRRIAVDYPVSWEQVVAQTEPGATVGRPHVADALVAAGVVPDRNAAFDHILAADSPYYVPYEALSTPDVIDLVRRAGGVPVVAHPGAVIRGRVLTERKLDVLVEAGLEGVEVDHRDHDAQTRQRLRDYTLSRGLIVTGSSDYHGAGKLNQLAENTTSQAMVERIAAAGVLDVIWPTPPTL